MTTSQPDNTPATTAPAKPTLSQIVKRMQPEIQRALPKGLDADRMARLVMTTIRKTPKLAQSTPESFCGALLTAAALGLEPGVNGECYLVPYSNRKNGTVETELILGYQGITKLYWQSPLAEYLDAQWVGSNDDFAYEKGLTPYLRHRPADDDRGEPTHYYAVVRVKGASQAIWDVFTAAEIKTLRRGKVGSSGDIPDPQHWMERKTALKQVLKLAPKSANLALAEKSDERSGAELYRDRAAEAGVIDADVIDDESMAVAQQAGAM